MRCKNNIAKMFILFKTTYRFNVISTNMPMVYIFHITRINNSKFYMEPGKNNNQKILRKKKKVQGITFSDQTIPQNYSNKNSMVLTQ